MSIKLILATALFTLLLINTTTTPQQPIQQNNTTTTTFNPHNQFNKIYQTPYNEHTYNCLNKSVDFATYLKNNNQTNIKYVNMRYKSGEYSHQFVLFNEGVYDPTSGVYNISETDYINFLEKDGFTGIIFTSPA